MDFVEKDKSEAWAIVRQKIMTAASAVCALSLYRPDAKTPCKVGEGLGAGSIADAGAGAGVLRFGITFLGD